jgi:O-antigen ligase
VTLLIALVVAGGFFALFRRWERNGRVICTIQLIMVVLLLDAALYPDTTATALVSVFHPSFGSHNIRLTQVLLSLALLAKVTTRGLGPTLAAPRANGRGQLVRWAQFWWALFFIWYAVAGVTGHLRGYNSNLVLNRSYLVIEAGGMLLLALSVPLADWLEDRGLPRLIRIAGGIAAVLLVLHISHVNVHGHLPKLPLVGVGRVGPDAATLFLSLGLVGLATEVTRPVRRRTVLLASVVLILAHAGTAQRAARVGLVVSVVVFVLVLLWPRQRRFRVRGGELVLVSLAIAGLVAGPLFARSVEGVPSSRLIDQIPIIDTAAHVASTNYRQGSVQSRYNEWHAAWPLIKASPVTGGGLGETFTHWDVGTHSFVTFDETNNILLDVAVRTGFLGDALLLLAVGSTVGAAARVWRRSRSDEGALMCAMALATLIGLLGKGMVESILNEYRLTPLLGLLAGLVLAAAADLNRSQPAADAIGARP